MRKSLKYIILLFFITIINIVSISGTSIWTDQYNYYKLEDTTDYYSNNDLTNNGATSGVTGKIENAYDFESTESDSMYTGLDSDYEIFNFTACAWVKPESFPDHMTVMGADYGSNPYYGWILEHRSNGEFIFWEWGGGTASNLARSGTLYNSPGTFYHVCVVQHGAGKNSIYVNGVWKDDDTGVTMSYSAGNHKFTLGYSIVNGGRYYDGVIDEVVYYDVTLSSVDILNLYTEQSAGRRPFNVTSGLDLKLVYPLNETHYNNYNGSIIVNVTNALDCDINNNDWSFTGNDTELWRFDRLNTPDGNYSIVINCSDPDNEVNISFWFVVDQTNPIITVYSPVNNSMHDSNIWVNVTYTDTNLYRANTTIFNSSGNIIYNNYSGDLNQDTYDVRNLLDISTLQNGEYTLNTIATDDHTVKEFKEELKESTTEDSNEKTTRYNMEHGNIYIDYDKDVTMKTIKTTDRWKQEYSYDEKAKNNLKITVRADKIVYREHSPYACHLIINDNYWYDCEGLDITRFIQNKNKITFWYDRKDDKDLSESIGGLNIVEENRVFHITRFNSFESLEFKIPTTTFSTSTYTTIGDFTFNLSNPKTIIMFGSFGIEKITGGGTSEVYMKVTINDEIMFDQKVNTLTSNDDVKISDFPIFPKALVKIDNNITIEVRRTGNGAIRLTNLMGTSITNTTYDNHPFNGMYKPINTETVFGIVDTYKKIDYISLNKYGGFKTRFNIGHLVSVTNNAVTVNCYLNNTNTSEVTPIYTRYLSSSGSIGSTGLSHVSYYTGEGVEQWDLYCKVDVATTLTSNATTIIGDLGDKEGEVISSFQVNKSNINGITGINNLYLNQTYTVRNGSILNIGLTTIIQSTSGTQDNDNSPTIYVEADGVNQDNCYISMKRSLSSNDDIGTIKSYINCKELNVSDTIHIKAYITVATGETLNILMATMNCIESISEEIKSINVAPTINILTPVNASTISDIINITWLVSDFNSDTTLVNVTLINATDTTQTWDLILNTVGSTYSFNTSLYPNGDYYINSTVWETNTIEHYSNNDIIIITISNAVTPIPPITTDCLLCLNSTLACNESLTFDKRSSAYFQQKYICNGGIDMIGIMIGLGITITFLTIVGILLYYIKNNKENQDMKTEILNKLKKFENESR